MTFFFPLITLCSSFLSNETKLKHFRIINDYFYFTLFFFSSSANPFVLYKINNKFFCLLFILLSTRQIHYSFKKKKKKVRISSNRLFIILKKLEGIFFLHIAEFCKIIKIFFPKNIF